MVILDTSAPAKSPPTVCAKTPKVSHILRLRLPGNHLQAPDSEGPRARKNPIRMT